MTAIYAGKSVWIPGGSSGIGLAIAKQLARSGANVRIFARNQDRLQEALGLIKVEQREPSQRFGFTVLDVSAQDQVREVVDRLSQEQGPPDFLFNTAGIVQPGYIHELEPEVFRQTMEIDYFGTVNITQALLPAMIERGSGHIVNFSSPVGLFGLFGYAAYSPAKYAVRGYTDVLRLEMKSRGIQASIVFPPDTDTPQLAYDMKYRPIETVGMGMAFGVTKAYPVEKVAETILRDVARGKYQIFPGFDSILMYRVQSLAMGFTFPIMDWLLREGNRKLAKTGQINSTKASSH